MAVQKPEESVFDPEKVEDDSRIDYDIHMHSGLSDGETIFEMASSAKEAGLETIAITDHEDYEDVENLEIYIETVKEANNDFDDVEILVGLEINYETNERDRYKIAERLEESGLGDSIESESKYHDEDIENRKREKAANDKIDVSYGSVHDVDGAYVKKESEILEKLHEDYLKSDWESIDNLEEVENEKIQEINEKIEVIKEAYADIYTEKVKKLSNEGNPFKFIAHPDLPLRNSVLRYSLTDEHLDEIVNTVGESELIPEINGKGIVRQYKEDFGSTSIDKTEEIDDSELIDRFKQIISNKSERGKEYFQKIAEKDLDYVTGSDSHRSPEIELRNYYFELYKQATKNEPLTLEEVKEHIKSEHNAKHSDVYQFSQRSESPS